MVDPVTTLKVASLAVTAVKTYFKHKHKEEMKQHNELLLSKIDTEIKLYENGLILKLNKANSLFKDSLFATNEPLRIQYLNEAKSIFTEFD